MTRLLKYVYVANLTRTQGLKVSLNVRYGALFGFCQEMFHERARLSSTNEANIQRLMAALKDKETALKVRIRSKTSCKIIWMVMSFCLLWRLSMKF